MSSSGPSELRGLTLSVVVGLVGLMAAVKLPLRASGSSGPEPVAVDVARRMRAKGDAEGALRVLRECGARDPKACRCIDEAGEVAVDLAHYAEALGVLGSAKGCADPRHDGTLAEALVGLGHVQGGLRAASNALARSPDEPHASFAKAWALSMSGYSPEALAAAETAVKRGRGLPALLLLGTLRSAAGDPRGAREAIEQAARFDPDNPRASYDLGVVEQGEGHYRQAREAYLHALALDPKLRDARYNLIVLTHSVGANDEARHHLEALAADAPDDPRLDALRAALVKP